MGLANIVIVQVLAMAPVMPAQIDLHRDLANQLTLDSAITQARQSSYQTQHNYLLRQQAQEGIEVAKAHYDPILAGGARASYNFGILAATLDDFSPAGETARADIGTSFAIYDGGARDARLQLARLGLLSTSQTIQENGLVVKLATLGGYYDLVTAQRQVAAANEMIAAMTLNLKVATDRLQAGDVTAADVQLAESMEDAAQAALARAKFSEVSAQLTLAQMLGKDPATFRPVADVDDTDPAPVRQGVLSDMVTNSPGLALAMIAIKAAEQNVKINQAARRWHVTAGSSAGLIDYRDSFQSDLPTVVRPFLGIAVKVDIPLIDHASKEEEKMGRVSVQLAQLQADELERTLRVDGSRMIEELSSFGPQIAALRQAVKVAAQSYKSTADRYAAGVAAEQDVLAAYSLQAQEQATLSVLIDKGHVISRTIAFEAELLIASESSRPDVRH